VGEFARQNEARNYPKHGAVNLTGIWRESLRSYPGRSDKPWTEGDARPKGAIACSDASLVYQKSAEAVVSTTRWRRAECRNKTKALCVGLDTVTAEPRKRTACLRVGWKPRVEDKRSRVKS
jgi:hypothetical protein